jgi:hypothetical protein
MTPPSTAGQVVVRLRLIGQMEAWTLTSENVLPAGRKTRALLAVIACHPACLFAWPPG